MNDSKLIKVELSDGTIVNVMYVHKRIMSYLKRCALPECYTAYREGIISAKTYEEDEVILTIESKKELNNLKK